MTDERHDLGQIQRWMQTVIMHPGGVLNGAASAEAQQHLAIDPTDIEQIISRSRALDSVDRLEIYARAYYARLLECMRAEFPVLAKAVSEDLFDEFAIGYLERYPSESYTLNHLGARFAQHLAETRPPATEDDDDSWPDFLVDLARLEWTFNEVFDGPGVENQKLLASEDLAAVPADQWASARLEAVPCLRLVELSYPVHMYYRAIREDQDPPPPEPATTLLAITRRDYVVRHYELERPQHVLLGAILDGKPLAEAIESAAAVATGELDEFAALLQDWFRRWSGEGFFSAVKFDS